MIKCRAGDSIIMDRIVVFTFKLHSSFVNQIVLVDHKSFLANKSILIEKVKILLSATFNVRPFVKLHLFVEDKLNLGSKSIYFRYHTYIWLIQPGTAPFHARCVTTPLSPLPNKSAKRIKNYI